MKYKLFHILDYLFILVGRPIEVPKTGEPSEDQLNAIHEKFIQSLEELFNTGRYKYLSHVENATLIID